MVKLSPQTSAFSFGRNLLRIRHKLVDAVRFLGNEALAKGQDETVDVFVQTSGHCRHIGRPLGRQFSLSVWASRSRPGLEDGQNPTGSQLSHSRFYNTSYPGCSHRTEIRPATRSLWLDGSSGAFNKLAEIPGARV